MLKIVLHATTVIPWQKRWTQFFVEGFKKHNIDIEVSSSTQKVDCDIAILFGPNRWKNIEKSGIPFIMVNRKFFGKEEHVAGDIVALSWDGFNGEGYHCVKDIDPNRLAKFIDIENDIKEWQLDGTEYLVCGQADAGRSNLNLKDWYQSINVGNRFRPHPTKAGTVLKPLSEDLVNVKAAITLNSTVAVEVLIEGIPVIAMDAGNPLYGNVGHSVNEIRFPERIPMLTHLAHCQWHHSEISNGAFWKQLYPKTGNKLSEFSV